MNSKKIKHRILIVEDNDLNMKLFKDLLDAHGYDTLETRDGLMVMEIVEKEMPDVIVLDIQLPKVSGIDVIRSLKAEKKLKKIPIVAVTAFAMKDDEDRIREAGCEAYIPKPIAIDVFIKTIEQLIQK